MIDCRHGRENSQVYTFSSPPTVIPSPRIRVSPPKFDDAAKKSALDSSFQPVNKHLLVTDDSTTEPELNNGQITVLSVSPARLGSSSNDYEKLLSASISQLSPMQSIRRSSLREVPEDEIRRSGVSDI